ncbi:MAG: metallophosphoesterase [Ignavibacteriae bacterium]|nr:metallophosphoesterase [Ignavibacteria bacterium]MBI3364352.1 metallophosphoesterase [Ignavibacteriota bacterium]
MAYPKSFHSARLSVFQSAVNEVVAKKGEGERGLRSGHPLMLKALQPLDAAAAKMSLQRRPWWFRWLLRFVGVVLRVLSISKGRKTVELCAQLAFDLAQAKIDNNQKRITELENQLRDGTCDPGWLESVTTYMKYYVLANEKPRYIDCNGNLQKFVYPLPEGKTSGELTVGILGDWGTGEEVASLVLQELLLHDPDVIIHVGDVYYSGTDSESQANFLDVMSSARRNKPVPVYNLPGNHDYYSGGSGFFNILSQLNKAPCAPPGTPIQEASFFCLRNSDWQLQGMDTGYYDHDLFKVDEDLTHLHDSEVAWHLDKITNAGERKIILFSHHQFFSAFQAIGGLSYNKHLQASFAEPLAAGRITAWFWGHEHLLQIYGPYLSLQKGRCIGYSAFPMLIEPNPYKVRYPVVPLVTDPLQPGEFIKLGKSSEVYNHGYAVMTLYGRETKQESYVSYYEIPGDGSSKTSMLRYKETL